MICNIMETIKVVGFIIQVIFFFGCSDGLSLHLNVNEPATGNSPICHVVCEDLSLRAPNSSGNMKTGQAGIYSGIERMSLFRGSESNLLLVGEVSSTKNIIQTSSIKGLMTSDYATLQVDLYDSKDCHGQFMCHVFMTNGQLKVVTTNEPDRNKATPTADWTTVTTPTVLTTGATPANAAKQSEKDTSDQNLDLTPHLISLIEDLHAKVAVLETKSDEMYFVEQRLSADVASIKSDLSADVASIKNDLSADVASIKSDLSADVASIQNDLSAQADSIEQRQKTEISALSAQIASIKDDVIRQTTSMADECSTQVSSIKDHYVMKIDSLKTDILSQTASTEQHIVDGLTKMEQTQKIDLSATQQSLAVSITSTEQRLSTMVADTERNIRLELADIEDKMDSVLQDKGSAIDCSAPLVSALKEDIEQLNKDIINSINYNVTALGDKIVNKMEDNCNHFDNISNNLETRLDQVFDHFELLGQNLDNDTCKQDITSFIETVRQEISNISCMPDENMFLLKHSQCKKGMLPINAQLHYPYPVFLPYKSSIIDKPYLCDTSLDFGGWILIQRRSTGNVSFFRDWAEYKAGFGSLDDDFWLGLEAIHQLTASGTFELRIDLKYEGKAAYALYSNFSIADEIDNYRLSLGSYSGTAGDSLIRDDDRYNHNGMEFSTKDRDHDLWSGNCASKYTGAWWYGACLGSNLNGEWQEGNGKALKWPTLTKGESASFSEMKIRKTSI